jgi:hypothetical protein
VSTRGGKVQRDVVFGGEIRSLYKEAGYIKITMVSGEVYTLHRKPWGYTVFKFTRGGILPRKKKADKRRRRAEREVQEPVRENGI